MSLAEQLKDRNIILASGSPRRQQFIRDLGLDFEIRLKAIQEDYPNHLQAEEIASYLAELKANAYLDELNPKDILITGDTIVWYQNKVLHKPKTEHEAIQLLQELSGNTHQVISSSCLLSTKQKIVLNDTTKVFFKALALEEIEYYVKTFKPYDKAGAYGIQEWIGKIGIEKIEGSFYTVMGMPVSKVYNGLKKISNSPV